MTLQKTVVIATLVCLMAFFNEFSFAQTTDVQANPALLRAKILAEVLKDDGYVVHRQGTSVDIETARGVLGVELRNSHNASANGETTLSLDGIELGAYAEATGLDDFRQLQRCWRSTETIYDMKLTLCDLNLTDLGDLLCKTGASFEWALNSLSCFVEFQQSIDAE